MSEKTDEQKSIAELAKILQVVKAITVEVGKLNHLAGPLGQLTANVNKADDTMDELKDAFKVLYGPRIESMDLS